MGMLTKLNELSAQQKLRNSSAKNVVLPSVRKGISRSLLPIIEENSKELMMAWTEQSDWKTTRYMGTMLLTEVPDGIEVCAKLTTLEDGIEALRMYDDATSYNDSVEQKLCNPVVAEGRTYCLPIYLNTSTGIGVLYISTDGPIPCAPSQ